MAIAKVILNGATLMDVTDKTVASDKMLTGYTALKNDGTTITGSYAPVTPAATKKQVNFLDFDGSLVASYTAQEANALSALPANPSHTGLTAQGWNWTLAQVKSYLHDYPNGDVYVGQMYITSSGATEIDVAFDDANYLSPWLGVCPNGTVTVDWGDNSPTETMTGTSVTTIKYLNHTYMSKGEYTITLTASNQLGFSGSDNAHSTILFTSNAENNQRSNRTYCACIKAIRLGTGVTVGYRAFVNLQSCSTFTIPSSVTSIGNYAFYSCYALTSLTIPSTVTSISNYAFQYCCSLTSLTIPSTVTSIGNNAFYNCYALTSLTIPSSVTTIGSSAFQYCYALTSLTIPSTVTSIAAYAFQYCCSLTSLTIPSSVTTIGTYMFYSCYALTSLTIPSSVTSIGTYAFYSCYSLTSLTIPSSVTRIYNSAFQYCYGMEEYHFLSTTPPTLSNTNAFSGIQSYTKIYVPAASLTTYQSTSNWSNYASYMVGE